MNPKMFITYLLIETIVNYVMILSIKNLNNSIKRINLKETLLIITASALNILNNYYMNIKLKLIFALFISFLLIKIITNRNTKSCTIDTLVFNGILFIIELILSGCLYFFKLDLLKFNNSTLIKSIFTLISISIVYVIFNNKFILNKLKMVKRNIDNYFMGIITISICFLNIITIYRIYKSETVSLFILTLVNIVFILLILKIINIYNNNIIELKEKNTNLLNSFKAYAETINECRELKHNLKNDLFNIKCNLDSKNQEAINELIKKYNKNYQWINNIYDIPEGLQGIIYLKQKEAEEKKVNFLLNMKNKIILNNKINMDLNTILGILLDNAIEATEKMNNKIIVININEEKDKIYIEVINNFNNLIDTSKIGHKDYSTKERNSGIGLNYVSKIKNKNIKVDYIVINNIFKSIITIKKI